MKDYEPRVTRLTNMLIEGLRSNAGTSLNVVDWMNMYTFDVMGDVGFGKPWGMLEAGKIDPAIEKLHAAMAPLGLLGPIPWLLRLCTDLPGAASSLQGFMDWCWNQLEKKLKVRKTTTAFPIAWS